MEGQIPFISAKVQLIDALCFLITLNNLSSSIDEREEEIIAGKVEKGPRHAYRR